LGCEIVVLGSYESSALPTWVKQIPKKT
jgi:hypothetical protein